MIINQHNLPSWSTPYHPSTGKLLEVSSDRSIVLTHSRSDAFKGWTVLFRDSSEVSDEVKLTCYFDEPGQEAAPYNSVKGMDIDDKISDFSTMWMKGDSLSDLQNAVEGWTSSYSG